MRQVGDHDVRGSVMWLFWGALQTFAKIVIAPKN